MKEDLHDQEGLDPRARDSVSGVSPSPCFDEDWTYFVEAGFTIAKRSHISSTRAGKLTLRTLLSIVAMSTLFVIV